MSKPSFETLLQTARECHEFLDAAGIAHVVIGGLAVRLHGYTRESRDVDLLVRSDDKDGIRKAFESAQYVWMDFRKAFRSLKGVRVDFRCGGKDAGNGEVSLPDPVAVQTREIISDLPVLALAHLIETKLACGLNHEEGGDKKHCKDVAELIITNNLSDSYANSLHKSVRAGFRKLVVQAKAY